MSSILSQAYHWCPDYEAATAEFSRILKPNGTVAYIWNLEDRSAIDLIYGLFHLSHIFFTGTGRDGSPNLSILQKCMSRAPLKTVTCTGAKLSILRLTKGDSIHPKKRNGSINFKLTRKSLSTEFPVGATLPFCRTTKRQSYKKRSGKSSTKALIKFGPMRRKVCLNILTRHGLLLRTKSSSMFI